MSKTSLRPVCRSLLFTALTCGLLSAQMTTTGSITGDVMDSSGHAIAGAKITVTSERTSEVRSANTNEAGTFNMIAVQPDTYNLRIEQKGFKVHERRGVSIAANEKVSSATSPCKSAT